MSLIESKPIPLGTQLPDFTLSDPNGKMTDSDTLFTHETKGVLIGVLCNHCPYAVAVWPKFITLAKTFKNQGIKTIAINPNINPAFPEDAPDKMGEKITECGIDFPYLVDEDQNIARSLKAQCTPDIYLFDHEKKLVYHGRIDDNWRNPNQVQSEDLTDAIESLIASKPINPKQHPTIGCSIKWL